jgi:hypothetical protein
MVVALTMKVSLARSAAPYLGSLAFPDRLTSTHCGSFPSASFLPSLSPRFLFPSKAFAIPTTTHGAMQALVLVSPLLPPSSRVRGWCPFYGFVPILILDTQVSPQFGSPAMEPISSRRRFAHLDIRHPLARGGNLRYSRRNASLRRDCVHFARNTYAPFQLRATEAHLIIS